MQGEEDLLHRENTLKMINRKGGMLTFPIVSRAGAEFALNWTHRLHTLQEARMDPVQNADGSFPAMRGWDLHQG